MAQVATSDALVAPKAAQERFATRRAVISAGLALAVTLTAACSSTSPSSSPSSSSSSAATVTSSTAATAPGELTGFGARDAAWNAHHTEDKNLGTGNTFAPGSTYGPYIPAPGGGENEWAGVKHEGGRVTGFIYALPEGTSEAAAKAAVLAQLPADTTTTLFTVQHDANGNSCATWNLRSPTIARLFGAPPFSDTAGDIGVDLSTITPPSAVGPTITYDPHNVDTAGVHLYASRTDVGC